MPFGIDSVVGEEGFPHIEDVASPGSGAVETGVDEANFFTDSD
jgi:hypothetical protein